MAQRPSTSYLSISTTTSDPRVKPEDDGVKKARDLTTKHIDHAVPLIRAVVIHPERSDAGASESSRQSLERLEEAVGLARALDLDVRGEEIVRIRKVTPATLFGSGKVEELAALVRAAEAEAVVIDDALSPVQQRNLEKAWDCKVIDRTGLILDGHVQTTDALRLGGAYGYVDAEFDHGAFAGNRIPFVARHTLSLNADYRLGRAWHLFGEAQYIGARVPQGDYANALDRLPGYTVFNASVDYRMDAWRFALRVDNLGDKRYSDLAALAYRPPAYTIETGYYPAPERSARLTAEYRFE